MTAPAPTPAPTQTTQTRAQREDRIGNAVLAVAMPLWFIFTIFAGGLVAALLSGFIIPFVPLPAPWTAHRLRQIAWVIGALIGAHGTLFGRFRPRFTQSRTEKARDAGPAPETALRPVNRSLGYAMHTAASLGIIFAFMGFVLGGLLIMMWFSVTMNPFAPTEWLNSVRSGGGGVRTSNPMVAMLWLGPILVLGVGGFLFGLIGAPLGWVTNEAPKQFRSSVGMKAIEEPDKV